MAGTSPISLLWTHALQELVVSALEHLEDEFDVPRCRIESNVAHKVRRYIRLFVASELISDVEGRACSQSGSEVQETSQ